MLIKSYIVISLFKYLGKVVEKLMIEQLSQFCIKFGTIHKRWIRDWKWWSAIDAATIFVE